MKLLQNRIAEGSLTLPAAMAFGAAAWLFCGLFSENLWPQIACFAGTVYILIELSNTNALLRIRSRMVSATFIVLSCASCFLFKSFAGCVVQLCFVSAFYFLFHAYQDSLSMGRIYYAFVCIGLASLFCVETLYYVPILWLLMAVQLQCLGMRTWLSSLLGLLTPYWFGLLWLVYIQDFSPLFVHFSQLFDLKLPVYDFSIQQTCSFIFILLLCFVGIGHFLRFSFEDKIRIRFLLGFFSVLAVLSFLLAALQPHLYMVFIPVAILCSSPLVAHLFTFTSSRLSNILFFIALTVAVALTVLNIII
ncbi:MAG: hypothetical protein IJT98_04550 [Prevotella sp.]|nr:hypothetical protein [Prevotella sp.]